MIKIIIKTEKYLKFLKFSNIESNKMTHYSIAVAILYSLFNDAAIIDGLIWIGHIVSRFSHYSHFS